MTYGSNKHERTNSIVHVIIPLIKAAKKHKKVCFLNLISAARPNWQVGKSEKRMTSICAVNRICTSA